MTNAVLHHGDALAVLPTLPVGAADVVITDPPYNSGGRTSSERLTQSARDKYVSTTGKGGANHDLADFVGDNRDQRSYGYWLSLVLAECHRVTGPGGIACVFTDWRQLPATSDALQAAGWTWRGIVAWQKPNNRPRLGGFRQSTEYIVWGTHGALLADRNPVCLPGLLTGSQPQGSKRVHITQKPVDVLRELVKVCPPGGTVLDPFAGSGSTGVAALAEDRGFLGVELSDHYHAVAAQRLGFSPAPHP
ncbi:MAG TPA: site-specific DNA-methyltransferase [Actinokineospora sp.]|nr:site-specific DNA-methyltransferase [Actinokineospora sp.]